MSCIQHFAKIKPLIRETKVSYLVSLENGNLVPTKRRQSCASAETSGFIRTGSRRPPPSLKYVSIMVFYRLALRERKDIRKK